MTLLTDLTITLIGYLILAISYLGLGWASSRILRIDFPVKEKPFFLIWSGWAITLFLLQTLNLFFPINLFSSIPFLLLGIILAIVFLENEIRKQEALTFSWIYPVLLVITTIWIAILSMSSPTIFDDGLYHFNSIRWLNEYPIVLGLGNLHSRLAFNQSFFAYVAYLNLYPLFNHGYNLANSFLLLVLLAECLYYLVSYVFHRDSAGHFSSSSLIPISFLPIVIYMALVFEVLRTGISSPSPDIASLFLQILLFFHFVRDIEENLSNKSNNARLAFILIMSATMITIKLSNLFYVVTICAILLLIRIKSLQSPSKQIVPITARLIALPILIIGLWIFRGILLSGCPAYPSTFGCLHVAWAEPINAVKLEANRIYSWARENGAPPDQVLNSWAWLGPWFYGILQGNVITVVYPVIVSLLGIVASIVLYMRSPFKKVNRKIFLIPLPIWVGLVFWFGLAPDPRFANALFWILPIAVMIVVVKILEASQKVKSGMILAMFLIINAGVFWFFVNNPQIFTAIPANGYAPLPKVRLVERRTLSGLVVWTPLNGNQCWDSRIPCTPDFNKNLNFIDHKIFPEFTTGK
jgi:hypothetical protein